MKTLPILFLSALFLAAPRAEAQIVLKENPVKKGRVGFTFINDKKSDVYVISFATGEVKPLVASPADDEYPVWSPDGKKVAYYSDASGDREVYVSDSDGKNPVQLTKSPGIDEDPDWSPDGKRIVFRSERDKTSNLYAMNVDGSDLKPVVTDGATKTVPRYSPDGGKLLFSTNAHWPGWDIELLDLQTGARAAQTSGIRTFCHAAWRPDGKGFLYSHGGGKKINLWLKTAEGEDKRLTEYDGKDYDATWIDNENILFVREQNPGREDYQLYHLNIPGAKITRITENTGAIRDLYYTKVD